MQLDSNTIEFKCQNSIGFGLCLIDSQEYSYMVRGGGRVVLSLPPRARDGCQSVRRHSFALDYATRKVTGTSSDTAVPRRAGCVTVCE